MHFPSRKPDFTLYLVTDRTQTRDRDLLSVLEQALAGGVKAIQLREKDLGGRELFLLAEKLKRLCDTRGASLYINDRIDIALGVAATGVQLGVSSLPVATARDLLGEKTSIGVSTHSLKEAEEAQRAGADFILFGPVYFTPSKAAYGEPQGVGRLKEVVEKVSLPVYAIGGIKPESIPDTIKTGVHGIALISAVLSASEPKKATEEILSLLHQP
jgi:thiamine-phosphate pyrophosphorylase